MVYFWYYQDCQKNIVCKTGNKSIHYKEERDGIIRRGTRDDAFFQVCRSEMINKYERIDPSRNIIFAVEDVNINAITQLNDNGTRREDMPMKNASQTY
jgi:hypothetical protein